MALQLRSGPVSEPISLLEAKSFLRIDGSEDDVLVSSLITAARIYIETTIGKILITESWSYFIDKWPKSNTVYVPLSPVQAIEEIRLYKPGNSFDVVPEEDYIADLISNHPRINFLSSLPTGQSDLPFNTIEIRFSAGFGDLSTDVPADLKQALLMLSAHWFEQRDPIGFGGSVVEVPTTIKALLQNYIKYRIQ